MTDARAVRAADVELLGAAAAGQLADRYRPRRGWRTLRTDRPVRPGAGPAGRTGGGRPVEVGRRVRRLVTAGLLVVTAAEGYEPRPYRLTDAGYAVLHSHSSHDLRRWWMTGNERRDDVSFYPTRTARQALARHRAARSPGDRAVKVRTIDGPLTTNEMLRRAMELDANWAYAWAVAARRGQGEVPTRPLDPGVAGRLLPDDVLANIAANVMARAHLRRDYLAAGVDPPDVLPSSRHSWHAWLGTATPIDVDRTDPADDEAAHGLTQVYDAPPQPPPGPGARAPAAARAFPPLRPGEDGPAALHTAGPITSPTARPTQTRSGPRR